MVPSQKSRTYIGSEVSIDLVDKMEQNFTDFEIVIGLYFNYSLICFRIHVEQQGPLIMNPPAEDNYGCDFCTLLCLPTTPVTLALATKTGTVYHCVVIVGDEEIDETGNKVMIEKYEK